MRKMLVLILVICLSSCMNYSYELEPIKISAQLETESGITIDLQKDCCVLISPICGSFPFFYMNNFKEITTEVTQCFDENDTKEDLPVFNVNIINLGFLSIGYKSVPRGFLLFLESGTILSVINSSFKDVEFESFNLLENPEFYEEFLDLLNLNNSTINFKENKKFPFFQRFSYYDGKVAFNLEQKSKEKLINYLKLLKREKKK